MVYETRGDDETACCKDYQEVVYGKFFEFADLDVKTRTHSKNGKSSKDSY